MSTIINYEPQVYNEGDRVFKCFDIRLDHKKHNKYTPDNNEKGKEAERMVKYFFSKKWRLPVSGNDLINKYSGQKGPDIRHNKSGLYVEVKNNSGKYRLKRWWVENQVVNRFPKNAKIKILALAHDTLTPSAREMLDLLNIKVVEWGEQLTGQLWNKSLSRLYNQLWSIYYRVKRHIPILSPSLSYNTSNSAHTRNNNKLITNKLTKYIDIGVVNRYIDRKRSPLALPPVSGDIL